VEVFRDSAHWPFVDNADRTRALVVPFLRPKLTAQRPSARSRQRRLRVAVEVKGVLPAYGVLARLVRSGQTIGTSGQAATLSGKRVLTLGLRQPLRAGRYALVVSARGLPTRRFVLRLASSGSPGSNSHGEPQGERDR
jgi:hypothetical protein